MHLQFRSVLRLSKAALLLGIFLTLASTANSAQDFYFYSGGVRTSLIAQGQDEQGRPLFQLPGSPDKSGTVIPGAQLTLTNQFMMHAAPGTDLVAFAKARNITLAQQVDAGKGIYLFNTSSPQEALTLANQAIESGAAMIAEPQFARQQVKRDLPNDPQFGNQWHLRNTGQGAGTVGADINVVNHWNFAGGTKQGSGVNIAVVDDGVQYTHPDLAANYKPNLSYDENGNDADPAPNLADDFHGTAVAGVAAGVGNNGIGISGVAPKAGISGIRLIAAGTTDAEEATALTFQNNNQGGLGTNHIYSNSWGPSDNGATLSGPGPLTKAALANAVANGRGGKGSIITWAGGNGNGAFDNSNYDGYANSRYVIAVAATRNNANGSQSSYSESGANILVNAPSSGGSLGITTTDLLGANGYDASDYTSTFGGTSSATPVVSGVIALMLEANPNLGWRDVKHILVRTAEKNDPGNAGWSVNAAGHDINHAYGFGTVDALAAATLATTWTNVGPEVSDSAQSVTNLGLAIPDGTGSSYTTPGYGAAVSNSLFLDELIKIEMLEISVNVTHTYRGDLQLVLTAPSGTQSILGTPRNDSGDNYSNWVFTSARHWDEMANGMWTLAIRDGLGVDTGTFNSWSITAFGTVVPEPSTIALLAAGCLGLGVYRWRRSRLDRNVIA